jgi:hypothetical protein
MVIPHTAPTVPTGSALASRTVIAAATGLHNALDALAVTAAWLSLTSIDPELVLELPLMACAVNIIRQRGAVVLDSRLQYLLHGGTDTFPVRSSEAPDFPRRAYTGQKETLTGIDIPDSDHDRGVHQEIFHRLAQSTGAFLKVGAGKSR